MAPKVHRRSPRSATEGVEEVLQPPNRLARVVALLGLLGPHLAANLPQLGLHVLGELDHLHAFSSASCLSSFSSWYWYSMVRSQKCSSMVSTTMRRMSSGSESRAFLLMMKASTPPTPSAGRTWYLAVSYRLSELASCAAPQWAPSTTPVAMA